MRHTAVIDGHRYTWLESLKMIGYENEIVICQSESGAKLACHSDVWETHEENAIFSFSDAKVKNKSSSTAIPQRIAQSDIMEEKR